MKNRYDIRHPYLFSFTTVVELLVADTDTEDVETVTEVAALMEGDPVRKAPVIGLSHAFTVGGGAGIGGPSSENFTKKKNKTVINIFNSLKL